MKSIAPAYFRTVFITIIRDISNHQPLTEIKPVTPVHEGV